MDREETINAVARTLFVCAWADGVEAGELLGEGPGAGGDWMDAAPTIVEARAVCSPVFEGPWSEDMELDRAVREFGAEFGAVPVRHNPRGRGGMDVRMPDGRTLFLECETREVPDPDALAEARRIVDAFDTRARQVEPYYVGHVDLSPAESSQRYHEGATGRDSFASCLAMHALGNGVGLEDDLPSGVELPGWITESVPRSDFSWLDLDPERYPAPAGTESEDA